MNKITTIIDKEWAEVFRNKLVLFSVIFLPLILLALPILTVWGMSNFETDMSNEVPADILGTSCVGMSESECVIFYMLSIYTLLFMILPVMIPITIAAYSIVGEKTTRSLEPILATPITSTELLLGKAFAAVIPAVVVSWIAYIIYAISTIIMLPDMDVIPFFLDPTWLVAIFVVGPLLTIFAVCAAIMVSSRVTDPRSAEQLAGLVVLPIILLLMGQSMGLILISKELVFLIGLIVAVLDAILVYLVVKTFHRETILTHWK